MSDKFKVVLQPRDGLDRPSQLDLEEAIRAAGWSDDPGTGKAVLLPDGSEMLNPLPIAPPVDFVTGPTLLEQFEAKMEARFRMLQEDAEVDTLEDFEDFDVEEDVEPDSPYTVVMHDEAPAVPPGQDPQLKPGEKPYPGEDNIPDQPAPAVPAGAVAPNPPKQKGKNIPNNQDDA